MTAALMVLALTATQIGTERGFRPPVSEPADFIQGPFIAVGTVDYDIAADQAVIDLKLRASWATHDQGLDSFLDSETSIEDVMFHLEGVTLYLPKVVQASQDPDKWEACARSLYLAIEDSDKKPRRPVPLRNAVGFTAAIKAVAGDTDATTANVPIYDRQAVYLEFERPVRVQANRARAFAIRAAAALGTAATSGASANFEITAEFEGYAYKTKTYSEGEDKDGHDRRECTCEVDDPPAKVKPSTDQRKLGDFAMPGLRRISILERKRK